MHFNQHQVLKPKSWRFESRQRMKKKAAAPSKEWPQATPWSSCGLSGGGWAKIGKPLQNNISTTYVLWMGPVCQQEGCSSLAALSPAPASRREGTICWGRAGHQEGNAYQICWPTLLRTLMMCISFKWWQTAVLFALCESAIASPVHFSPVSLTFSTGDASMP